MHAFYDFQSVIVKSIERNAPNMYLARMLLLGLHLDGYHSPVLKTVSNGSCATHSSAGLGLSTLGRWLYMITFIFILDHTFIVSVLFY